MNLVYELWDTCSGNQLGEYATEQEALNVVAAALRSHGDLLVTNLELISSDIDDPDATPISRMTGQELVARSSNPIRA